MTIDWILLTIYISHENELLVEQMKYLNNQFELANTKNLRWTLGYKYDEENDNFHCYSFFTQNKFPKYLEKRINLCHGLAEYAGSFASDLRTNKKIRIMAGIGARGLGKIITRVSLDGRDIKEM